MSRFFLRLFFLLLVAVAALLAFGFMLPAGPESQQLVQLKSGSPARRIAADLKRAGIIRSQFAFLVWHYVRGHKSLKAGEYAFDHPARVVEIYDRIARGDVYFYTVVVPEGFNVFDIAEGLDAAGLSKRDDFLQVAMKDTALLSDLDPQAPSLEGYLFPDTYHFTRTQSAHDIAAAMVHRFRVAARDIGLTANLHDHVTMASLVEKETGVPEERPVVAGVFENRLKKKMVLATDPAVVYAALLNHRYRGTIYRSDLQFDSPYNTYKTAGLPPGPICNPGRQALLAAMHPAATEYLYFVSNNQGHHRFARTAREHEVNVAAYRRAVARNR
jgi:UPF0755 protein